MFSKKERKIYGDVLKDYRPTIRTLILQILEQKLFNLKVKKHTIYEEGSKFFPETDRLANMPLVYLAVVNGGVVKEMIRTNPEAAKVLLKRGTKLVEFDPTQVIVKKGLRYKDGVFYEESSNDKKDTV